MIHLCESRSVKLNPNIVFLIPLGDNETKNSQRETIKITS